MSKPLIIQSASPPDSRRVFGPGAKALRVGLYARVSTHDQKTLPLQLSAMRDYAKKRHWTIAIEVQDVASGATTRPQREKLIAAARRREIDGVLVWRLARWGRSLVDLMNSLQELTALDIGFVSLSEELDLTTPRCGVPGRAKDRKRRRILIWSGAVRWPTSTTSTSTSGTPSGVARFGRPTPTRLILSGCGSTATSGPSGNWRKRASPMRPGPGQRIPLLRRSRSAAEHL